MEVSKDRSCEKEMPIEVNGVELEEWGRQYPGLFEDTDQYGHNEFLAS